MAVGSIDSAATLVLTALAPGAPTFALKLALMQVVPAGVLYWTALTVIVQTCGRKAQTSIVHPTLIAGFTSSLFWPLTTRLHAAISWREALVLYAVLHVAVCVPARWALARITSGAVSAARRVEVSVVKAVNHRSGNLVFLLMLLELAVGGYSLSAMLVHIVALTQALSL